MLGWSGWGAPSASGSSAPGAGVEQQRSEKMLLCCAFLAASLGPSFPSSGLYWAVGGSAVWTGHPSEAVSQRLGRAVCCRRGEQLPAACTHLCVLGLSVPWGSARLWEGGTWWLPSASGVRGGFFSLLLLCLYKG